MKLYYIVTTHFYDLLGHGPKSPNYIGRVASFMTIQHAAEHLAKLQKCYPTMKFWITEEYVLSLKFTENQGSNQPRRSETAAETSSWVSRHYPSAYSTRAQNR
jgi:hypothetical protein